MLDHPALRNAVIDKLYLDNTFFDPSHVFPSHGESVARAVSIARAFPKHRVLITTDMLGKDQFLYDIGKVRAVACGVFVMVGCVRGRRCQAR